jgi:hypothetical protein
MARTPDAGNLDRVELAQTSERDEPRILEAYLLLQSVLGVENVEDIDSFWRTVSEATDDGVFPKMICAQYQDRIQGIVLGAYLKDLNLGMVLYSAVSEPFRRRRVYSALRHRLIACLNQQASHTLAASRVAGQPVEIEYLVSEVEEGSPLYDAYVKQWGAFAAPCEYLQPPAQGLAAREMKLLFQPIANHLPPARDDIVSIVRHIYERVYRLPDATQSPHFQRVAESLGARVESWEGVAPR